MRLLRFVLPFGALFAALCAAGSPSLREAPVKAGAGTIVNSIGMKLVRLPAGEFTMGSRESPEVLDRAFPAYNLKTKADLCEDERPAHRVRITRPFYLGMHEVTVGQFRRFVEASGSQSDAEKEKTDRRGRGGWGVNARTGRFEGRLPRYTWRNAGFPQTDDHPVVNVTWHDAARFCAWLGRKEGKTYRLPTEAEWEYACRAGSTTRYHTGDDPEALAAVANVADATGAEQGRKEFPDWGRFALAARDGHVFTAPVGSYRPNAWGLFDMHGNVWEWCSDWHAPDYYARSPVDDPPGAESGTVRVRRGGAWHTFPLWVRSSFRNVNVPETRYLNLGFRVARSADGPQR